MLNGKPTVRHALFVIPNSFRNLGVCYNEKTMSGQREYYVYILTNKSNQVLYIGVTNNLQRRIYEHQRGLVKGFSKRYNLKKLVYYEVTPSIKEAIAREKQLKNWHRQWKINLITQSNPCWKDLSVEFSE